MRVKALGLGHGDYDRCKGGDTICGQLLKSDFLHEAINIHATVGARVTGCRKRVISARRIVTGTLGRPWTDKYLSLIHI